MSMIAEAGAAFVAALAAANPDGVCDADRIDELNVLERVKSAVCARQARVTDAFAVSQRGRLLEAGSKPADISRSVCGQVGLARRDSPTRGNRHVGLARVLVHEMPGVLAALQRGDTSEWRASIIARETALLSVEQRAEVDAAIGDRLAGWGDAQTEREARAWAQRLDPHGAAGRAAKAAVDRRVSIRPAPDCMTYLTALLPVKEGVCVYGELHRTAMAGAGRGDEHRSRGQIMADELVRRVVTPAEGSPQVPGLEVHLVMTDRALADADTEPAQLVEYGPVPAPVARDLVRADKQTKVWVRRLYTDPETGQLAATDAKRRDFPHVARTFLTARDQVCRTPSGRPSLRGRHQAQRGVHEHIRRRRSRIAHRAPFGAPIRHADHALAVSKGGNTDTINGNGRCTCCNLTKDLAGWATHVLNGIITTSTTTGHRYTSRAPKPPTSTPWPVDSVDSAAWLPPVEVDIQWPGRGRTSG